MQTDTWELANESLQELRTAQTELEQAQYPSCIAHCYQAVEKLLLAIWLDRREDEPPDTNDIVRLAYEQGVLVGPWKTFLVWLGEYDPKFYEGDDAPTKTQYDFEKTLELCAILRRRLGQDEPGLSR